MSGQLPEATDPAGSRAELFGRYLDFFRARVCERIEQLPPEALRRSAVPSGWTPLELLNHLTHVERRWLQWGFEGQDIGDPWADERDDRWYVPAEATREQLLAALRDQGAFSNAVLARHALDEVGRPSERWNGADPPPLERVLFHLLQEYARHLGHLDIVAELAGAPTGE